MADWQFCLIVAAMYMVKNASERWAALAFWLWTAAGAVVGIVSIVGSSHG